MCHTPPCELVRVSRRWVSKTVLNMQWNNHGLFLEPTLFLSHSMFYLTACWQLVVSVNGPLINVPAVKCPNNNTTTIHFKVSFVKELMCFHFLCLLAHVKQIYWSQCMLVIQLREYLCRTSIYTIHIFLATVLWFCLSNLIRSTCLLNILTLIPDFLNIPYYIFIF